MSSEFIHVVPRGFAAVVTKPITTSATKYRGELQGCPFFFLLLVIHGLTYQSRYQERAYEYDEVDIVLLRLYSQFKTEKRTNIFIISSSLHPRSKC